MERQIAMKTLHIAEIDMNGFSSSIRKEIYLDAMSIYEWSRNSIHINENKIHST